MYTETSTHPEEGTHQADLAATEEVAPVAQVPTTTSGMGQEIGRPSLMTEPSADTASVQVEAVVDSTAPVADEPTSQASVLSTITFDIDPVKQEELAQLFTATINNPRFWARESRVEALKSALVIPVFDDRALQQFFNHAMDDLTADAAKESSKTGKPVVMPTEEQGKALTWKRYTEKVETQLKKQLKKDGIKASEAELDNQVQQAVFEMKKKENAA